MTHRTLNDILLDVRTVQLTDNTPAEAAAVRKELTKLWQETVNLTALKNQQLFNRCERLASAIDAAMEALDV